MSLRECANCSTTQVVGGTVWRGHLLCFACSEVIREGAIDDLFDQLEGQVREARREREEQSGFRSLLQEANTNLLAELRKANERAEKAEAALAEALDRLVWVEMLDEGLYGVCRAPLQGATGGPELLGSGGWGAANSFLWDTFDEAQEARNAAALAGEVKP